MFGKKLTAFELLEEAIKQERENLAKERERIFLTLAKDLLGKGIGDEKERLKKIIRDIEKNLTIRKENSALSGQEDSEIAECEKKLKELKEKLNIK